MVDNHGYVDMSASIGQGRRSGQVRCMVDNHGYVEGPRINRPRAKVRAGQTAFREQSSVHMQLGRVPDNIFRLQVTGTVRGGGSCLVTPAIRRLLGSTTIASAPSCSPRKESFRIRVRVRGGVGVQVRDIVSQHTQVDALIPLSELQTVPSATTPLRRQHHSGDELRRRQAQVMTDNRSPRSRWNMFLMSTSSFRRLGRGEPSPSPNPCSSVLRMAVVS